MSTQLFSPSPISPAAPARGFDVFLIDIDGCVYSNAGGFGKEIGDSIERYMVVKLGFDKEKVHDEEFRLYRKYGTSLSGCVAEGHKVDFADYFKHVHGPLPYAKYLRTDPELRRVLLGLKGRRVGFTNSDAAHAQRVVEALGISNCFDEMLTFETFNPHKTADKVWCKPSAEVFAQVFQRLNIKDVSRVAFLDDSKGNIKAGKAAGLYTVFVGSEEKCEGADVAVKELKDIVHRAPELFAAPTPVPSSASQAQPERVIIDCDPGVDDMMALLLAFASPELVVEGITIVMGNNNNLDILAENACRALAWAKHTCVPVVKGECKPKIGDFHGFSGIKVHGDDGIGNVGLPPLTEAERAPLKHDYASAAEYIVRKANDAPGQLTLITLGPLTNISKALDLDPSLPTKIRRVVSMGGSFGFRGNKTPVAEANIANDPEAAAHVFDQFHDITLAHLGVTHQLDLVELLKRLKGLNAAAEFIEAIAGHYVTLLQSWGESPITIHDSCAVMAIVKPSVFQSEQVYVVVETGGRYSRGLTVADWLGHLLSERKQGRVLRKVDTEAFYNEYVRRIAASKMDRNPCRA